MNEEINQSVEEKNPLEERMRNLVSDKKVAEEKATALENEKVSLAKERDFYASFSDSIAKYPSAPEYKDKIKEKVMSGYSVEDATISILHSEGKLIPTSQPIQRENVSGGSAPNQITNNQEKTVKQMSSPERWEALREAERRGDIGLSS